MAIDWGLASIAPTKEVDTETILETMMKRETMNQEKKMWSAQNKRDQAQEDRMAKTYADDLRTKEIYDMFQTSDFAQYDLGAGLGEGPVTVESARAAFDALNKSPDRQEAEKITKFLESQQNIPAGMREYIASRTDFNPEYDIERNKVMQRISELVTPEYIDREGAKDPLARQFLDTIEGGDWNRYARFHGDYLDDEKIDTVSRGTRSIGIFAGNDESYDRGMAKQLQTFGSSDDRFDRVDDLTYTKRNDGSFLVTEHDSWSLDDKVYAKRIKGKWKYSEDGSDWLDWDAEKIQDILE